MSLSHSSKVAVRRALRALRTLDDNQRLLESQGHQIIDSPTRPGLASRISAKTGFRNRTDLEQFARKHHLL